MALRSRGGVAALAVAMILVQLFDAMIGFRLTILARRTAHGLFCDKFRVAVVDEPGG